MKSTITTKAILYGCSFFLFTACIGTGTVQILKKNYEDVKVFNTSITLLPLTEDIIPTDEWNAFISEHPESKSTVNERNKGLFNRYFSTVFEEVTTAKIVDGLDRDEYKVPFAVKESTLAISDKEKLPFLLPDNEPALIDNTHITDYTLMVQSLNWKISYEESSSQAVGRASSSAYEVVIGFRYVLWNNNRKEVVAYGKMKKKSQYLQVPSKTTYIEILEELCRQIVIKSPLQEKSLYG